jgi:hypothetical protein
MIRAMSLVVAWLALAGAASGQQPIPRTSDGHPDFGGVWSSRFLTVLERPDGVAQLVLNDEQARALARGRYDRERADGFVTDPDGYAADVTDLMRVNGEWRSSFITEPADGKLPLNPDARRARVDFGVRANGGVGDGPEARPDFERCLSGTGVAPLNIVPANNMRQIVQTPDHVVVYTEEGGDVRIIPFGDDRRRPEFAGVLGASRARWEGDTLVVETLGHRPQAGWRGPLARIIERFMLVSPDEILYRFTIEDASLYTARWTAEYPIHRSSQRIYEYACQMANYSLPTILAHARETERRAAAARPGRR